MAAQASLTGMGANADAVPSSAGDMGADLPEVCEHRNVAFREKAHLLLALVCLTLLIGAVIFSDLDSDYATSARMTGAIQRALGLPRTTEAEAHPSSAPAPAGGGVILVAENDDARRVIAKTTLERYGYTVALVDNGPQAVELFRKSGYQVALVLLGRADPAGSSEETVEQLRRIRTDVPIVISDRGAGHKPAAGSGAVARVDDPFSAMSLAEAIRAALGSRQRTAVQGLMGIQ